MPKNKTTILEVPLNFSATIVVPAAASKAIDDSIDRGEISLGVSLAGKDSGNSFMFSIYPDQFDGSLTFSRAGKQLAVTADGVYKLNIGSFEREHISLPADIRVESIGDANADTYQLSEDETGLTLGEIISLPK
jgi:hypothetical protein